MEDTTMADAYEFSLPSGEIALVDADDRGLVDDLAPWYAVRRTNLVYVQRNGRDGRADSQMLHRVILQPPDDKHVDHINHNGLDNRRQNLRVATNSQNQANRRPEGGSSKFKGVYRSSGKWVARGCCDGLRHYLGRFVDERDAAEAYDAFAESMWGENALLNRDLFDELSNNRQGMSP